MILNQMDSDINEFYYKRFKYFQNKKNFLQKVERVKIMKKNIQYLNYTAFMKNKDINRKEICMKFFITDEYDIHAIKLTGNGTMDAIKKIDIKNMNADQVHDLMVFYGKLRTGKNKILINMARELLTSGRVVNLFVDNNGSPSFVSNAIIIYANERNVKVSATVDGKLVKTDFDISVIDGIYPEIVRDMNDLKKRLFYGIKTLSMDEIFELSDIVDDFMLKEIKHLD